MTSVIIPNEWKPRPYQLPVLQYFARGGKRAVLQWARRLGKDDVSMHQTAIAMINRKGNYWHMLPEYSQARKAIWEGVDANTGRRRIDWVFPKAIRARTNDSEMSITLKNGSTWRLCGSDNYDTLVGAGVAGVVFSEYSLSHPAAWGYIAPMLEQNGGWAIFNYTVRGDNHAVELGRLAANNPDWFFSNVTAKQSGVFSQQQLERIKAECIATRGYDEGILLFQQEYENNTTLALPASIYGREIQSVKEEGRIRTVSHRPEYPVYTFWDLGIDDATSILFAQFYDGKIWILDYAEHRNQGMSFYLDLLKNKADAYGYRYAALHIPHDGANREWISGSTRREQLEKAGYRVVVLPAERVADGINAARGIFGRCVFDQEKTKRLLECLVNYRRKWNEENKIYSKEPLHDWASHGADAFRYLALGARADYQTKRLPDQPAAVCSGETWQHMMLRRAKRRRNDA